MVIDRRIDRSFLAAVDTTQTVHGVVAQSPTPAGQWQRIILTDSGSDPGAYHGTLLVRLPRYPQLRVGEEIDIRGKITLPAKVEQFDYAAYLARQKIFVVMEQGQLLKRGAVRWYPWYWLAQCGARLEEVLAQQYTEPTASFLAGVLLGARRTIPQDLQIAVQRTGTAHVLAVSGFNITILLVGIAKVGSGRLHRSALFIVQGVVIVLFVLLTGATASAVRAGVMGLTVTSVRLGGRLVAPRTLLLLCAVAMVAINPRILLFDLGFQLSFLAVAGLFIFGSIASKIFFWVPVRFGFRETITASLAAQIFTTPIIVWHFAILSLSALFANLLILPTIPLLMAATAIALGVGLIMPTVGDLVARPIELLSRVDIAAITKISAIPWSAVVVQKNTAQLMAIIMAVGGLCLAIGVAWWARRTTCFSCRRKILWV